jgi:hypothetical protein
MYRANTFKNASPKNNGSKVLALRKCHPTGFYVERLCETQISLRLPPSKKKNPIKSPQILLILLPKTPKY